MRRRLKGEGTIYARPDGRLAVQVELPRGPDGKRRRRTAYAHSRAEARRLKHDLLAEANDGQLRPHGGQTLGAYLTAWLAGRKGSLAASTWRDRRVDVTRHIAPALGHLALDELDVERIQTFLDGLTLAPGTVQGVRSTLTSALKDAVRRRVLAANPAALTRAPTDRRPEAVPFSVGEAQALLDAARGTPLEALWALMVGLGIRPGEALALRWSDVNLERGEIRVTGSMQRGMRGETKTPAARRVLPLPAFVAAALGRLAHGTPGDLVFRTARGRPVAASTYADAFRALLRRLGLPRRRPYDLRHTCASLLFAQGVPAKTVAAILGHSKVGVTLDVYTHLMPAATREAATAMDAALGSRQAAQFSGSKAG